MEDCLRTFILHRRIQSKLSPAHLYLSNVLSDVVIILASNLKTEKLRIFNLHAKISSSVREYEKLKNLKRKQFGNVENEIRDLEERIAIALRGKLNAFLSGTRLI